MSEGPTILVSVGSAAYNEIIREAVTSRFPQVKVLVAVQTEEIAAQLPQAEILCVWSFPGECLSRATRLRWLQVMGAGVDWLVGKPLPPGVVVTNLKGVFGPSMGEYALAYMLAHAQNIATVLRQQQAKVWSPFEPGRLQGKTVGIVGLGSIGKDVARRCAALGMRVIGLRRRGSGGSASDVEGVERVYGADEIEAFLPQCDYLVLVLPHTPETEGMLTRERLRLLPRHCFMVNMGRGTVYREADLVEALGEKWIAGAALDVFAVEPLPPDSPLWDLDNVYITPHIAGTNDPNEHLPVFLDNLDRYLQGQPLLHQVDLNRGY